MEEASLHYYFNSIVNFLLIHVLLYSMYSRIQKKTKKKKKCTNQEKVYV